MVKDSLTCLAKCFDEKLTLEFLFFFFFSLFYPIKITSHVYHLHTFVLSGFSNFCSHSKPLIIQQHYIPFSQQLSLQIKKKKALSCGGCSHICCLCFSLMFCSKMGRNIVSHTLRLHVYRPEPRITTSSLSVLNPTVSKPISHMAVPNRMTWHFIQSLLPSATFEQPDDAVAFCWPGLV